MARANHDAFRDFAVEAETSICACRAKMCAVHTLLEGKDNPGEDVMDAVRTLVAEAWTALDHLKVQHGDAFTAAREART